MDEVVGHQNVLNFFAKVIKNGNLSHAYCFVGSKHVGKTTVAKYLASELLQVKIEKLVISPDFATVEQMFDEKTEKTKKNISVQQIRDLREVMSRTAYLGGYKVAIIDEGERMNGEAANALLKTLEEPKEKTIIFILTEDETLLPATIRSRCQMSYFYPVEINLIAESLLKLGLDQERAYKLAKLSCGLPGLALNWFSNTQEFNDYEAELKRFWSLFGENFHNKNKIVEDLYGDKTDAILTRGNLQKVLSIWQLQLRDLYLHNANLTERMKYNFSYSLPNEKILFIENKIIEAEKFLNQNIHPRLLLEQILLELP